jgi:hypothetical protein
MAGKHSESLRGLDAAQSPLFQGKFGRLFRNLPAAQFGKGEDENTTNLEKLGEKMSAKFDKPFDGPDPEESGIPSLYTYFGQFVDHDITFDPMSSLMKQADPDALTDFRNPAFDLDNVYGRGPGDQPYMYTDEGMKFLLGEKLAGGDPNATDLPRNRLEDGTPGRALIGDPRNDENSIVSQLQGLFLRFHNRLVDDNKGVPFEQIQQLMRFHYQYVVLHDFLPRIVNAKVLADLKSNGQYDQDKLKYFHWRHEPFMPVEFSVAAYRLGHSMVRPGYRLNDKNLLPIFPVKNKRKHGLTGFQQMAAGHGIDWGRFIDIDERAYSGSDAAKKKRLQFAYRIDTSLVNPLKHLPPEVVDPKDPPDTLASRNLLRAWRLGLPTGQDVALAMGLTPLKDSEILISKAVDPKDKDPKDPVTPIDKIAGGVFAGNCPLWTYILAEAAHHKTPVKIPVKGHPKPINTPQLGPVGGRIVAETFLGLMFGDGASMLSRHPHWCPTMGKGKQAKPKKDFKLKDFVRYALGDGPAL